MDTNAILTGSFRQHMVQSQCNDVADRYILRCVYYQIVMQYAETVSFTLPYRVKIYTEFT